MSLKAKITAAAATLTLATGMGMAATMTASAAPAARSATIGCNALTGGNGVCGSVALKFGHYSLDVYQQRAQVNNKIILWTKSNSDPAQDFYAAQYNHTPNQFTMEYAPNGIRSGLCVSFPSTTLGSTAVLRHCNEGPWQTDSVKPVSAGGSYFEIKNQASGLVMEDRGFGNQGTRVAQWSANGGDNQLWKPFS
jgi:hypothetical protein